MNLYRSASSMQVQPVFDPSGGEAGQKITYLGTTPGQGENSRRIECCASAEMWLNDSAERCSVVFVQFSDVILLKSRTELSANTVPRPDSSKWVDAKWNLPRSCHVFACGQSFDG